MMKVRVTGTERDIANSAWISTLNEVRAQSKSDEEVERVVKFLVDNSHTSPLESVTITMEYSLEAGEINLSSIDYYRSDLYSRCSSDPVELTEKITIDLLNFLKVTYQANLWDCQPWKIFSEENPKLAALVSRFGPIPDTSSEDVSGLLGKHKMQVELINLHDEGSDEHSRATWRVKCPLSIGVQILRHRKGSYNMVSGRYRTIFQEMMSLPDDCDEYSKLAGEDMLSLFSLTEHVIAEYKVFMKKIKMAKQEGKISNDQYKRLREVARFVLPEGRMTELYVTFYLSDFKKNFVKLRDSVHAQTEHIWIAQEMQRTLSEAKK